MCVNSNFKNLVTRNCHFMSHLAVLGHSSSTKCSLPRPPLLSGFSAFQQVPNVMRGTPDYKFSSLPFLRANVCLPDILRANVCLEFAWKTRPFLDISRQAKDDPITLNHICYATGIGACNSYTCSLFSESQGKARLPLVPET